MAESVVLALGHDRQEVVELDRSQPTRGKQPPNTGRVLGRSRVVGKVERVEIHHECRTVACSAGMLLEGGAGRWRPDQLGGGHDGVSPQVPARRSSARRTASATIVRVGLA